MGQKLLIRGGDNVPSVCAHTRNRIYGDLQYDSTLAGEKARSRVSASYLETLTVQSVTHFTVKLN